MLHIESFRINVVYVYEEEFLVIFFVQFSSFPDERTDIQE